jgi:hypothetical protein
MRGALWGPWRRDLSGYGRRETERGTRAGPQKGIQDGRKATEWEMLRH